MRWIYLSPHLDDSILSAGGLIYEQARAGQPVEIWTFMCGYPPPGEVSPFAQFLHQQWGISEAAEVVTARRAEDVRAAKIAGAQAVHFDFLDCIYRRGKNGEWLYADVFVPPHEEEDGLPAQIAAEISARLQPDDELVCQFALGSHLDHVLVRRAAERLGRPLRYVVDIPYLFTYPDQLAPKTAGFKQNAQPVSEAGLKVWKEAVSAYSSQMGTLFESPEVMSQKFDQYWAENGKSVNLWQPG